MNTIDGSKLPKMASVSFALACCFSNIQATSLIPFYVAAACSFVVLNTRALKINMNSMRANACAMWLVGGVVLVVNAFTPSALVIAASDFVFGAGNFLSARSNDNEILVSSYIRGWKKVINHPASFYSLGYVCTALLASRITVGSSNSYALASMGIDIAMTLLSFIGLMTGRFRNPAASFMALVVSSIFGIIASALSGNFWGILNKFFSGAGEFSLACKADAAYQRQQDSTSKAIRMAENNVTNIPFTILDLFYKRSSLFLIYPIRLLKNHIVFHD